MVIDFVKFLPDEIKVIPRPVTMCSEEELRELLGPKFTVERLSCHDKAIITCDDYQFEALPKDIIIVSKKDGNATAMDIDVFRSIYVAKKAYDKTMRNGEISW